MAVIRLSTCLINNIKSAGGTVMLGSKAVKFTGDKNSIDGVELENGDYIEGKHFIAAIHPDQILDMMDPGMIRKAYSSRIRGLETPWVCSPSTWSLRRIHFLT